MKQVKAYEATDGALFPNKEECEIYESALRWKEEVDRFLSSEMNQYRRGGAGPSIARATIVAWELWKSKQGKENHDQ